MPVTTFGNAFVVTALHLVPPKVEFEKVNVRLTCLSSLGDKSKHVSHTDSILRRVTN
jgi:hypothetical protein